MVPEFACPEIVAHALTEHRLLDGLVNSHREELYRGVGPTEAGLLLWADARVREHALLPVLRVATINVEGGFVVPFKTQDIGAYSAFAMMR